MSGLPYGLPVRADRLVSLVLLLRQRGRLTADQLARELEVSTRTVLRDVEALSAAGVPVYAERGRYGGFALLPGFRTELTGLTPDETLALLVAGAGRSPIAFGPGTALAAAHRKVLDALPEAQRLAAEASSRRLLVEPETDLLSRRAVVDDVPADVAGTVRAAVLEGRRLRMLYAAAGQDPRWRTVDPVGLVGVRDRTYLLAGRSGADRTYRLSRVLAAERLDEPAQRSADVDLAALWRSRCEQFLADGHVAVAVRVRGHRRDDLLASAVAVRAETPSADGWLHLQVTYQDDRHAVWAAWQLGDDAEVLSPSSVRAALHDRATALARRYRDEPA